MATSGQGIIRYFEGTRYVGQRIQFFCSASAGGPSFSAYFPHIAYFCPHCGEVWGRAVCEYQFNYKPVVGAQWVVESRRCPKHGDGYFLTTFPAVNVEAYLDTCSHELLLRESFLLLTRQP